MYHLLFLVARRFFLCLPWILHHPGPHERAKPASHSHKHCASLDHPRNLSAMALTQRCSFQGVDNPWEGTSLSTQASTFQYTLDLRLAYLLCPMANMTGHITWDTGLISSWLCLQDAFQRAESGFKNTMRKRSRLTCTGGPNLWLWSLLERSRRGVSLSVATPPFCGDYLSAPSVRSWSISRSSWQFFPAQEDQEAASTCSAITASAG